MKKVVSFDIGTGSVKADLWTEKGEILATTVVEYETHSAPDGIRREQDPDDWWRSVDTAMKTMMNGRTDHSDIVGIALSGHSLGVVAIDQNGKRLVDLTPIWSDARAEKQSAEFFRHVDYRQWYLDTGCGFNPALYGIFKIMWYKENEPDVYHNAVSFIGSKDYVNLKMTGKWATDRCYAGGSGAYILEQNRYSEEYLRVAGIDPSKMPRVLEPHDIVGTLLPEVAKDWGLSADVAVACGSVDNSCMCLGAGCIHPGEVYASLGSSAWIAGCATTTALDFGSGIYTFPHCIPGYYTPGVGINSAGTSLGWIMDHMWQSDPNKKKYRDFDETAQKAPIGANGVTFCPTLAGGGRVDAALDMKGAIVGLSLGSTREDVARSVLEGVSCELRLSLEMLAKHIPVTDSLVAVGGGACSDVWLDIYANVFNKTIIRTAVLREAASLGAAALAFKGTGVWQDYEPILKCCEITGKIAPKAEDVAAYQHVFERFKAASEAIKTF